MGEGYFTELETSEEKHNPLIYVLMVVVGLAAIALAYYLETYVVTGGASVSLVIFMFMAWYLISKRATSYRYTLEGSMFTVENIVGRKTQVFEHVSVLSLEKFGPYTGERYPRTATQKFTLHPKEGNYELVYRVRNTERKMRSVVHLSPEMAARIQAVREGKSGDAGFTLESLTGQAEKEALAKKRQAEEAAERERREKEEQERQEKLRALGRDVKAEEGFSSEDLVGKD